MKKILKHLAALLMVVCILNGIPFTVAQLCGSQAYAASSSADRYCRTKLTKPVKAVLRDTEKKQNRVVWYPVKGAKKYVVSRKAGKNGT